jgi:protease I
MATKKVIMVLPPLNFDGRMFDITRRILEARGYRPTITCIAEGVATSDDGMTVPIDLEMREVKGYEYDAVIYIGGEGARIYFDNARVRSFADDMKYKALGVEGDATVILALAGLMQGKRVTGNPDFAGVMIENGAIFTNQPFEKDERLITVQSEVAAEQLAYAIIGVLEG